MNYHHHHTRRGRVLFHTHDLDHIKHVHIDKGGVSCERVRCYIEEKRRSRVHPRRSRP